MKDLFKKINKVDSDIAEFQTAINNIRQWPFPTSNDQKELDKEKNKLFKAQEKKLQLLARLEDLIQVEREAILKDNHEHATAI